MAFSSINTQNPARRQFVVVADSDAKSLFYTSTLLQRFQYNVWTAKTGAEALEMTTIAMPGLIVTAQYLEDMTGVDLIRKLKKDKRAAALSVIVLTRKKDAGDERACLAAGAVTCLAMPVRAEDLYRVIQVAIEPIPRMNIRINTRLWVSINDAPVKCEERECVTVISEHGAYVRTFDPYPLKTKLTVQIRVAGRTVSADAVVIYRHQAGNKSVDFPGMGLQFVRMSPEDQERIRLYIRNEITKGI